MPSAYRHITAAAPAAVLSATVETHTGPPVAPLAGLSSAAAGSVARRLGEVGLVERW